MLGLGRIPGGKDSRPGVETGEGNRAGMGAELGSIHCKEVGIPVLW